MKYPTISVIIPAFNAAKTLARTLESIRTQLVPDLEVIVVDDGSTDGTNELARHSGNVTKVLKQENGGAASARNRGLAEAAGEWIAFLDADDIWTAGSLCARMEMLAARPLLGYVMGQTQFVAPGGSPSGTNESQKKAWTSPNLGSGLFRRELFLEERVGLFAEDLRHLQDIDWFWRAREAGIGVGCLEKVTLWYYRHDEGSTAGKDWDNRRLGEVIRRSLRRRRAKGMEGPLSFWSAEGSTG